jgi:hypothetical protein
MIVILKEKPTPLQLEQMKEEYGNYLKVVVDIEEGILAGGGEYHVDAEQELIKSGHKQSDLWGGGIDLETGSIDYNSMINIRPNQVNPGRDVASEDTRMKMDKVIKRIFL